MDNSAIKNMLMLVVLFFILMIPQGVSAHALLEKATPAPDSYLKSSPKEIVLIFNERLEKELYSIKVFNEDGDLVGKSKTKINKKQKQIMQDLPTLPDGIYTISYSVLSADGHAVKGTYVVSIGEEFVGSNGMNQLGLRLEDSKSVSVWFSIVNSVVRTLYYTGLLATTGWIIWGTFSRMEKKEIRAKYRQWALYCQIVLLITTAGMGLMQFADLLDRWAIGGIWTILTNTTVGITFTLSMLLSVSGFAILLRNKWVDRLWVFLFLLLKSVNGHAMAFDSPIRTVLLDIIHLLAAAIWSGGLLYILVYWRNQRAHAWKFLLVFSKVALISILTLIVSGVASTFIFLPKVHYLLYTEWGILLLIKVALVLFVIAVGSVLRHANRKQKEDAIGRLLKIDFTVMILILAIVGTFTHLSPVPQNKPLEWHEQEHDIKLTTTITPKVPGNNLFMVEAFSIEEEVKIKRVEMFLINKDNSDIAPIQVPFDAMKQSSEVAYMMDGQYLPFSGNWKVEVRIIDSEDNERIYSTDFIVY